jgi:hypothetical protein
MKSKREWAHPSNLHDVYAAMLVIAEQRALSVVMLATYQGKLAVIEGVAHEFAHQLEAGRNFDLRLRASSDEEANNHEAAALRIEVAALTMLGVRVSLRPLWREANWRSERPPLTRARRALSDRERKCAAVFSRIVRGTIQSRLAESSIGTP